MKTGTVSYFSCILLAMAVMLSLNIGVLQENIETIPQQEEICCIESKTSQSKESEREIPMQCPKSFHSYDNIIIDRPPTLCPRPFISKGLQILHCIFRE